MKLWHVIAGVVLTAGGYGLFRVVSISPPGQKMTDMGREHVTSEKVSQTVYNSNPPTSGPHLPTWVKPGIYDTPQSEGELIHSLEHGYVIISYNCGAHLTATVNGKRQKEKGWARVFAHEEDGGVGSPSAEFIDPTIATASAINETDGCKALIQSLTGLAKKKKLFKLIIVPRPQLDTTLALTAWTYIDTFDPPAGGVDPNLIGIDAKRIERFIDYHRDHGPEKTME